MLETVTLALDGRERNLVVGYVAETPVWRPSYRLVVESVSRAKPAPGKTEAPTTPTAQLQGWGIVQNLSGEDWKGITLSLVAGAPIAFQATLEQPVVPPRPVVSDTGEVIASVPLGETTMAEVKPPPPPPSPQPAATAGDTSGGEKLDSVLKEATRRAQPSDLDEDLRHGDTTRDAVLGEGMLQSRHRKRASRLGLRGARLGPRGTATNSATTRTSRHRQQHQRPPRRCPQTRRLRGMFKPSQPSP